MIRAVVFDLDDTLYSERDFLVSGYRAVASHVARRTGFAAVNIFEAMMAILAKSGRREVFPMVVSTFLDNSDSLSELIGIYRSHRPEIRLLSGYRELLTRLRREFLLGIITDGIPEVQRRKVSALGLEDAVDQIIYTWDYGREREKPDPLPFSILLRTLGVEPSRAVYVGDNDAKDCIGAHRAGMKYIKSTAWGRDGIVACLESEKPDFTITSLLELPRLFQTAD